MEERECDAEAGETAPPGGSFDGRSFPGRTDSSVLCYEGVNCYC